MMTVAAANMSPAHNNQEAVGRLPTQRFMFGAAFSRVGPDQPYFVQTTLEPVTDLLGFVSELRDLSSAGPIEA
jgi:hypothetical protein